MNLRLKEIFIDRARHINPRGVSGSSKLAINVSSFAMPFRHSLLLVLGTILCQLIKSRPESRFCFEPLPGPEIRYNFYACSIVLNWNITQDCGLSATGFQVQYLNECTRDGVSSVGRNQTHGESLTLPNKIPGECLMSTNCYARVRIRLNGTTWSKYSAWTTLSNNYEAIQS